MGHLKAHILSYGITSALSTHLLVMLTDPSLWTTAPVEGREDGQREPVVVAEGGGGSTAVVASNAKYRRPLSNSDCDNAANRGSFTRHKVELARSLFLSFLPFNSVNRRNSDRIRCARRTLLSSSLGPLSSRKKVQHRRRMHRQKSGQTAWLAQIM